MDIFVVVVLFMNFFRDDVSNCTSSLEKLTFSDTWLDENLWFYSSGEKRIHDNSNSEIAGLDAGPANKKKKNKHKKKWVV